MGIFYKAATTREKKMFTSIKLISTFNLIFVFVTGWKENRVGYLGFEFLLSFFALVGYETLTNVKCSPKMLGFLPLN